MTDSLFKVVIPRFATRCSGVSTPLELDIACFCVLWLRATFLNTTLPQGLLNGSWHSKGSGQELFCCFYRRQKKGFEPLIGPFLYLTCQS